MSAQLRSLVAVIGVLVVVLAGAGWWVYQAVQLPAIQGKPPVSAGTSPLSSPVLDQLKTRLIVGPIPVADPGSSHRIDPFTK